jgi:outer membrane protein
MQITFKWKLSARAGHGVSKALTPLHRGGLVAATALALQWQPLRAQSNWQVDAGPALVVTPQYPGSRGELTLPLPMVDISFGPTLFLNTEHGLGAYAVNMEGLQVGSSLWFRRGRFHDESSRLTELGDIDNALQGQVFARYRFGPIDLGTTLERDFGGSSGLTIEPSLAWRLQVSANAAVALGAQGSFGSSRAMQAWFGVTPEQARASGLAQYAPGAGFSSVGPIASLNCVLSRRWTLRARLAENVLTSKASNSPIVERTSSPTIAIGATYHFLP